MPSNEPTNYELRIRELERRILQLTQTVGSLNNKVGQVYEDNARPDDANGGGNTIFHAITTSAVSARVGTAMGSGTFSFVSGAGGVLTTLSVGSYTGYTDSSTGWATGKYCRVAFIDGQWEFITADAC